MHSLCVGGFFIVFISLFYLTFGVSSFFVRRLLSFLFLFFNIAEKRRIAKSFSLFLLN